MPYKRTSVFALLSLALLLVIGTAVAATIDPVNRTVTTSKFFIDFSQTNPEEITYISWNGLGNLTNTGVTACGDPLEYFGNSWASPDSIDFVSLVGWGQSGTWTNPTSRKVTVNSVSESTSGCYGAMDIPVETNYQFWDKGPVANRIKATRSFDFSATPLMDDFRPYIPRLYPLDGYTEVYHPDASGSSLAVELSAACPLGCEVSDWDNSWFAMHNPTTGQGVIVRHGSSHAANLWVDEDLASFTNASSVLLLEPAGGFTGQVTDVQFMCFYDSTLWTPSLSLPPGC